jgi:phage-related baseplate assembly protein
VIGRNPLGAALHNATAKPIYPRLTPGAWEAADDALRRRFAVLAAEAMSAAYPTDAVWTWIANELQRKP